MDTKELGYDMIFPLGQESHGENFTSAMWLHMMAGQVTECPVGNVTFEPGCRNSWHTHGGGQVLLSPAAKAGIRSGASRRARYRPAM